MTSVGSYLVETLITLFVICGLAVLVLYGARRAGLGRASGPLALVGRLPLDGRRAVYLVRVGKLVFVIGGSEAGLSKLGELSSEGLELALAEPATGSFRDALARVMGQTPKSGESP